MTSFRVTTPAIGPPNPAALVELKRRSSTLFQLWLHSGDDLDVFLYKHGIILAAPLVCAKRQAPSSASARSTTCEAPTARNTPLRFDLGAEHPLGERIAAATPLSEYTPACVDSSEVEEQRNRRLGEQDTCRGEVPRRERETSLPLLASPFDLLRRQLQLSSPVTNGSNPDDKTTKPTKAPPQSLDDFKTRKGSRCPSAEGMNGQDMPRAELETSSPLVKIPFEFMRRQLQLSTPAINDSTPEEKTAKRTQAPPQAPEDSKTRESSRCHSADTSLCPDGAPIADILAHTWKLGRVEICSTVPMQCGLHRQCHMAVESSLGVP